MESLQQVPTWMIILSIVGVIAVVAVIGIAIVYFSTRADNNTDQEETVSDEGR